MEARMQPRSDGRQRCLRFELTTQPRARVYAYQDPMGNVVHHFDIPSRHTRLTLTSDAVVSMAPWPDLPESLAGDSWGELDAMVTSGDGKRLNACQMCARKIQMPNQVENILSGGFNHAD